MIPKTIHYFWFGGARKPAMIRKCMKSWKRICPDYQVIEWNESNIDIADCPLFVRQAYEAEKWAFVTDYLRLWAVHEYGGIYLDADVELVRRPDFLLCNRAYFGFEEKKYINTGLGFGAEKGHPILRELMYAYENNPFVRADDSIDNTPCPVRDLKVFLQYGLQQNNQRQMLKEGVCILPSEYLNPYSYKSGKKRITPNTISIHWFAGSWLSWEELKMQAEKRKKNRRIIREIRKMELVNRAKCCILSVFRQ